MSEILLHNNELMRYGSKYLQFEPPGEPSDPWPTDGLVDRWTFDDTLIGTVNSINLGDTSANISYTTGMGVTDSKSVSLGGSSWMQSTDSDFLDTIKTRNTFTWVFWFAPTNYASPGTFAYITDNNLHAYSNADGYYYNNTGHLGGGVTLSNNDYHMYTFYYDGSNYGRYFDAANNAEGASTTNVTPTSFRFGAHTNGSSGLVGKVTMAYLYSRELTSTEVSTLYNSGDGM